MAEHYFKESINGNVFCFKLENTMVNKKIIKAPINVYFRSIKHSLKFPNLNETIIA